MKVPGHEAQGSVATRAHGGVRAGRDAHPASAAESPSREAALFWIPDHEVVMRISRECRALDIVTADTHHALWNGARAARVVVLALDAQGAGEPQAMVAALHSAGTAATVVGWVQRPGPVRPEIMSCIRQGLDALICGSVDALITGLTSLYAGVDDRLLNGVLDDARRVVPRPAWRLLRPLALPSLATDVSAVARGSRCANRTLERQFRDAHLPSPAVVLAWLRLFLLAHLMSGEGRTLGEAARQAGFPSELACRRALSRRGGLTPPALRRDDACEVLRQRFATVCQQAAAYRPTTGPLHAMPHLRRGVDARPEPEASFS